MEPAEIEDLEIDLLLDAIFRRHGYDFRNYARATIHRRVRDFCMRSKLERVSQLVPLVLYEEDAFQALAYHFSIPVTAMFRDPPVYHALREKVFPLLHSYPFIRIWHAGCASGEEVYSLAILLQEADLLDRSQIYATDFNDMALDKARKGIFPIDRVREYSSNYREAGGQGSLSEYYHADYDSIAISTALKKNITFANHNLTADEVFGEMHLVMCRNVLIYFNKTLQNRVLRLFRDSLCHGGFLCLGTKESLQFSEIEGHFLTVAPQEKIFKKRIPAG